MAQGGIAGSLGSDCIYKQFIMPFISIHSYAKVKNIGPRRLHPKASCKDAVKKSCLQQVGVGDKRYYQIKNTTNCFDHSRQGALKTTTRYSRATERDNQWSNPDRPRVDCIIAD